MKAFAKRSLFFAITMALVVASIYFTFTMVPQLSTFAAGFAKAAIAIAFLYAVDSYLLPEFDTLNEIKHGNTSVALVILAYAILVGLCVSAA